MPPKPPQYAIIIDGKTTPFKTQSELITWVRQNYIESPSKCKK